jgi:hypothetical protein
MACPARSGRDGGADADRVYKERGKEAIETVGLVTQCTSDGSGAVSEKVKTPASKLTENILFLFLVNVPALFCHHPALIHLPCSQREK